MGMAAGQARLLSITSRMSDNELRAQLINNDKMRLATKSSQASENYVKALNEAEMMFTNYDEKNNTTFQKLTFNAMTAFNPYNNQYSLSNASGKLLVSEKDAANFKNSTKLEDFLKLYGLEQTTTYFKGLPTVNGQVQYPTTAVDANGDVVFANAGTPADLQKLYEGIEGNTPSYENILASDYYYNYTDKLKTYTTAQEDLYATVAEQMIKKLNSLQLSCGGTLGEIEKSTKPIAEIHQSLANLIDRMLNDRELSKYLLVDNNTNAPVKQTYLEDLKDKALKAATGLNLEFKEGNSLTYTDNGYVIVDEFAINLTTGITYLLDEDENITDTVANVTCTKNGNTYNLDFYQNEEGEYSTTGSPENHVTIRGIPDKLDPDATVKVTSALTEEESKVVKNKIVNGLRSAIYNIWDPSNEEFIDKSSSEYANYVDAARDLANTLGITNLGTELSDYEKLGNITENNFNFRDQDKRNEFNNIVNSIILDNVMNTYGEPKYTWIDTSKPNDSYNVNGEAKAQWYTNLYERMKKTGYEVLKDGLASSAEWIKFALESGIVTMEQVDDSNNWKTIMYSNCSDITEKTDSAAVAKAEAEYNAAMNKIENKDKMYDLELKNIDTEHNSLQTEYDSIKSAIDKNIERTFKLYG